MTGFVRSSDIHIRIIWKKVHKFVIMEDYGTIINPFFDVWGKRGGVFYGCKLKYD